MCFGYRCRAARVIDFRAKSIPFGGGGGIILMISFSRVGESLPVCMNKECHFDRSDRGIRLGGEPIT